MFRTLVVLMFLAISLLLLEVNGSKRCLPESPDEYICTEAAIFGEDRTQLSELYSGYSGGVKQQVEGSESEKVETAKTILSMTVYLRDLFKTHPDIAPKWCVECLAFLIVVSTQTQTHSAFFLVVQQE